MYMGHLLFLKRQIRSSYLHWNNESYFLKSRLQTSLVSLRQLSNSFTSDIQYLNTLIQPLMEIERSRINDTP
jgi:hypothetical protein